MKKMKQIMAILAMLIICSCNLFAQAPTISGLSTTTGPVGTLLTVYGTNLGSPTALKVGGSSMVIVSKSSSELVGLVMPSSNSGTVAVTNAAGTATSASSFSVIGYAPPNGTQSILNNTNITTRSGQGKAVAISADGNTVVVGSPEINTFTGSIDVWYWDGGSWNLQANKLTATSAAQGSNIGWSVAISADGNTVIAGARGLDNQTGGAYIFTRSGTTWSQQGNKMQGTGYVGSGFIFQGHSVAISADGNTALIGGYADNANKGAAWVFTRSGTTWTQQGSKLTANNYNSSNGSSWMGIAVALSADGNMALLGASAEQNSASNEGAAWIFTRSGTTWTQQAKINATSGASTSTGLGSSVALSADGTTAVLGASGDNGNIGAMWVFTRSGSTWTQQGSKIIGTGAANGSFNSKQSWSVAITGDGNTILSSGIEDNSAAGAIWVYRRSGTTWTQQGSKIVRSGSKSLGYGLAITLDGSRAVAGAPINTTSAGGYAVTLNSNGNNMADFSDVTIDGQSLTPIYSAGVLNYTITLTKSINEIIATTQNNGNASVSINGGAYNAINNGSISPLSLNVGTNTINLKVTSSDNTANKIYTITASKLSADLSALSLSSGTLSPVFTSVTTSYNTSVSASSITVTPTLADAQATMQVRVNGGTYTNLSNNTASGSLALNIGSNTIDIKVTASNGTTTNVYTITVGRGSSDANLSAMLVTNATIAPSFSNGTTTYSASVSNAITSTTITPTLSQANATMQISYNGGSYSNTTSGTSVGPLALNVGSNTINIKVNAQDGVTTKIYTTTIIRAASSNANLSNMTISVGTLSPVFAAATTAYNDTISNATTSVTVTATKQDSTAVLQIRTNNGSYTNLNSGTTSAALAMNVGVNTIDIKVTAEDGSTIKTYRITVTRISTNANLSALVISSGSLSPAFAQATTSYTNALSFATTSIIVVPTKADAFATITARVNGGTYATVNSGTASASMALNVGVNTIDVLVTAQDGTTTKQYTVTVTRKSNDANLTALTFSLGSLSPSFAAATIGYTTANVGATSATVTPTKSETNATIQVRVNGGSYATVVSGNASNALALNVGSNTINILVTAQDASFTQTYTITVVRLSNDANLSALSTSAGTITPSFAQATTFYTAPTLATGITSVTVTPTKVNANATLQTRVNGGSYSTATNASANTINLSQGLNVIEVLVTAEDGTTTKTYTINVTRTCGSLIAPTVSISTASTTVCNGSYVSFTATPTNGGSSPIYQWKKNSMNIGTGSSISLVPGSLVTGDTISCVMTANYPCQSTPTANSNKIRLTVLPSPSSFNIITPNLVGCSLGSTANVVTNTWNTTWTSSNPAVATVVFPCSSGSNGGAVTAVSNGITVLTATVTGANGCATSRTALYTVNVVTPPVIFGSNTGCTFTTEQYTSDSAGGVWSSNNAGAPISATGLLSCNAVNNPTISYKITNASNCSATTTKLVTINASPLIPGINYAFGTNIPYLRSGANFCNNRNFTLVGSPAGGVWSSTNTAVVTVNNLGVVNTVGNGIGSVTYTVTNAANCSSTATIVGTVVACSPRGLSLTKDPMPNTFTIYPNPARSIINLKVETLIGAGCVVVTDLYGKQLTHQTLSMGINTIDASKFAKGMYLVSVITEQGKETRKVIIE